MEDKGAESESDSVVDSSEEERVHFDGEYKAPNFNIRSWSPKGPGVLDFICLVPFAQGYEAKYDQSEHINKVKISSRHRQQRMQEFHYGRTTCRNIIEERRLRNATSQNDYQLVVELLDSGVDPCAYDEKKRTALHIAASQGFQVIVKVLLDKGADPNQKDVLGNTPLHLAACTCQVPVVTLLLKAGTDLKSVDTSGRTPLSLAKSRLRMLAEDKSYSNEQLKGEVFQVLLD
ncbi:hypothetical protein CHS0354_028824 [Potamilus streckersoni]|uniref:Uncharacterized protein n=1 Tax=Potamilus streckersoni TaxID=2493646 RepID=A0AAE0RY62_9BIVA|nr:hypothetical protein CHS0354_028824 [Potamilus streckersoni]